MFAYCDRRNFRTQFNFVLFVCLAESTKFSGIRKPCTYNSVCDTVLAVQKFVAYESSRTREYEIFIPTKISAITIINFFILQAPPPPPPPLHPLWTNLQPIHILFSSVQLFAIAFFAGVNRRMIGQLLAKSYNSCRRLCQLESAFTTMLWTNNHPIDLILLGFLQLKEKKEAHFHSLFWILFPAELPLLFFPESLRGTYISSRLSLYPLYYHKL